MSDAGHVLEEIRVVELETARQIETAREDAEAARRDARRQAAEEVAAAKQRGTETAGRRFEAAVAAAEADADSILAACDEREEALRRAAAPHREAAVTAMVELLVSPPLEKGK